MRFVATTAVGTFVAALALASSSAALPALALNPLGGGQYLILLSVDGDGLTSIEWDVVSDSGLFDTANSAAIGFLVPSSDPACQASMGDCNFIGVLDPSTGHFAVFAPTLDKVLRGAPAGQPFTVGLVTFDNPGAESNVSIVNVEATLPPPVPEPPTSFLLAFALLGLGVVARGRSSRAS